MTTRFNVVLVNPDIPGNTGTIGRTCVALDLTLILIRPYGFKIDEKTVRRAGLDYWKHVKLKEYDSWEDFIENEKPSNEQLFFFSTKTKELYYDAPYSKNCYLVFGRETKGLAPEFFEKYPERFYTMPMFSEEIRSLNLANAATAVCYETLRCVEFK